MYSQPPGWRPPAPGPSGPQGPPPPPWQRPGQRPPPAGTGRSPLFWVLLVIGIAAAVTIGGCVACAGLLAVTAEQEQRAQQRNTITDAQGRAVGLGTPRSTVRARLGAPASPRFREERGQSCEDALYYNVRGGEPGDQWQLCFERGRLVAKYRWA